MFTPFVLSLTAATLLLAGFIKGVIGGGLPTISIGILGLVMPIPDAVAPFGWRYGHVEVFDASSHVRPLAAPGSSVAVARLLPDRP